MVGATDAAPADATTDDVASRRTGITFREGYGKHGTGLWGAADCDRVKEVAFGASLCSPSGARPHVSVWLRGSAIFPLMELLDWSRAGGCLASRQFVFSTTARAPGYPGMSPPLRQAGHSGDHVWKVSGLAAGCPSDSLLVRLHDTSAGISLRGKTSFD